jgi:hypothetical protein
MLALCRCRLFANLSRTTSNCLSKLRKNVWMTRHEARSDPSHYAWVDRTLPVTGKSWCRGEDSNPVNKALPAHDRWVDSSLPAMIWENWCRGEDSNLHPSHDESVDRILRVTGRNWCRGEDSNLRPSHDEWVDSALLAIMVPRRGFEPPPIA